MHFAQKFTQWRKVEKQKMEAIRYPQISKER